MNNKIVYTSKIIIAILIVNMIIPCILLATEIDNQEDNVDEAVNNSRISEEVFDNLTLMLTEEKPTIPSYKNLGGKVVFRRLYVDGILLSKPPAYLDEKVIDRKSKITFTTDFASSSFDIDWENNFAQEYVRLLYSNILKDFYTSSDIGLAIDNYGNIITNNMEVVLPFYMNKGIYYGSSLYSRVAGSIYDRINSDYNLTGDNKLGENNILLAVNLDGLEDSFKSLNYTLSNDKRPFYIAEGGKIKFIDNLAELVNGLPIDYSPTETRQFIKKYYYDRVKELNEDFVDKFIANIENGQDSGVYSSPSNMGDINLMSDPSKIKEEMAENLIKTILTGGAGDFIKLTIADLVSETYENLFVNFSSKYVFYTSAYTESPLYKTIYGVYIVVIAVVLILYVSIGVINIIRGVITFTGLIKRVSFILVLTIVPVLAYPKVVDVFFNKPTEMIAKNGINKMLILDRWSILSERNYGENRKIYNDVKQFRDIDYNYIIRFNTEVPVNEKDYYKEVINLQKKYEGDEYIKRKSNIKSDRVQVLVDANHLIDYLTNQDIKSMTLFEYIGNNKNDYGGLSLLGKDYKNKEYKLYIGDNPFISNDENLITSSEIMRRVFKYYRDNEIDIMSNLNTVSDILSSSEYYFDNTEREQIIAIACDIPGIDLKTLEYYRNLDYADFGLDSSTFEKLSTSDDIYSIEDVTEEERRRYIQYIKELKIAEMMIRIGYGDLADIHGLIQYLSGLDYDFSYSKPSLGMSDEEIELIELTEDVRNLVKDINRSILDDYMSSIYSLNDIVRVDGKEYNQAVNEVITLNIAFNLLKNIDKEFAPTKLDISKIESDVYMRSLVVPSNEITPENGYIKNASTFVTLRTGLETITAFFILVFVLMIYGLMKLMIVSILLLPVLMVLLIITYIIKEDFESKLWYGVIHIIFVLALVHAGFIGLWRFCSYMMNLSVLNSGIIGGKSSFFNPTSNTLILIIYFLLVSKYIIVPTAKVVKANIGDLGGAYFMQMGADALTSVKKRLKNSSSILRENKGDYFNRRGFVNNNNINNDKKDIERNERELIKMDRKREKLDNDLNSGLMSNRSSSMDKASSIEEKIELRKSKLAGISKNLKEKTGLDIPFNRDVDIEIPRERIKELRDNGIFIAKVQGESVNGAASSKIDFKNKYMANTASEFFTDKGFNNKVDDTTVHIEATKDEIKPVENDLNNFIKSSKDRLLDTGIEEREVLTNIVKTGNNTLEMDYNKAVGEVLDSLKEENVIEDIKVEDGRAKVKVKSNNLDEIIQTIEKASSDINDIYEYDIKKKKQLALSKDNKLVEEIMSNSKVSKGVDYDIRGNKYVSVSPKGYKEFNKIKKELEKRTKEIDNEFNNFKEIEVTKSNKFKESELNKGRRHVVSELSYSPKEIIEELEYIKQKPSKDEKEKKLLEESKKIKSIKVLENDKLSLYTNNDVTHKEISKLLVDLQRYRKNRLKDNSLKEIQKRNLEDRDNLLVRNKPDIERTSIRREISNLENKGGRDNG